MNWNAIGAVGEVVGAAGVIVSLIYLASQIRHSAKTTEDSVARDLITSSAIYVATMAEGENRDIVMKGLVEYRSLTAAEKFTFDSLMTGLLNFVESSFISARADLFTNEPLKLWSDYLQPRFLGYQGFLDWWSDARGVYMPEMRTWIDNEIANANPGLDFWKLK